MGARGKAEKALGGRHRGAPLVETEGEFVQVSLEVVVADAVGPPARRQVRPARLLAREAPLELRQGPREIRPSHPYTLYIGAGGVNRISTSYLTGCGVPSYPLARLSEEGVTPRSGGLPAGGSPPCCSSYY